MVVSGYTVHLYCDRECVQRPNELPIPNEFAGTTKRDAYREARNAGWKIGRGDVVTCPACCKGANSAPANG